MDETEVMSEEEIAQTLEAIDEINLQELEAELAPILDTLPAAEPVTDPELEAIESEVTLADIDVPNDVVDMEAADPMVEAVADVDPMLEAVADVDPMLEAELEAVADVDPMLEAELEAVADADPMLEAELEAVADVDPMIDAVADIDPMLEAEVLPEIELESETPPEPEVAETMLEAMSELDQVLEPDPMREPDPTFNPDPEPEFEAELELESEPELEPIQELEPEIEYEPEPEPEPLPPAKSKVDCVETETSELADNIRYKMSIIETISHLLAGAGTEVVEAVAQAIGSESALPLESTSAYESKVDAIEESIAEFADSIRQDLKVMEAISKLLSGAGEDSAPTASQSKSKKSASASAK